MVHYGARGGGAAGDGSWGRRVGTNVAREFEDYDHTPYGGGYDITQVYGRPIPPSEETCYPITRASSNAGQPRPSAYAAWGKTAQEPHPYGVPEGSFGKPSHPQPQPAYGAPGGSFSKPFHPQPQPAYGAPGGSFGKPSHTQPQPAYGFHPQQEVAIDDGHVEFGYGGGTQLEVDYGLRPGSYTAGGYDQPPSGLGFGHTGSRPARREETSHGYGYGQGHQTGMVYPVGGHGPAHGYVEGNRHKWPHDHGPRSGYMEQVYGPVSSLGREPSSYGQMEQRQGSHGIHQGYGDDVAIEEEKHYHQKYRHHH